MLLLIDDYHEKVPRNSRKIAISFPFQDSITFSEEVAYRHLLRIVGDEPRVAGTLYHLNKTHDMKAIVDEVALQANQVVRTDWQFASGEY